MSNGISGVTSKTVTSPGNEGAKSIQPPWAEAVAVVMNNDSPPRTLRLRPFIRPPSIFASRLRSAAIAIMAPDSARIASEGPRMARATENEGLCRSWISMRRS